MKRYLLVNVFTVVFTMNVNSQSWSNTGTGVDNFISAFAEYNGDLYASGNFFHAGGIPTHSIAKWNGTTWDSLADVLMSDDNALAVYNSELYVGGDFGFLIGSNYLRCMAKWNGSSWSDVGGGMSLTFGGGQVNALTVYNGELYAGGWFDHAGGFAANSIAKWNGSLWDTLESGIGGVINEVYSLAVYNNELYAGGMFTDAGGNPVNNIARWNGSSWDSLGSGVNFEVHALMAYNGELYVGGGFSSAGGNPAFGLAKWNGTAWTSLNSSTNVNIGALALYNGDLYVGGAFNMINGIPAANIARWNGSTWSALGSGLHCSGLPCYTEVNALAVYNSELYAGGYFDSAGSIPVNSIAKWMTPLSVDENSESDLVNIYPNPSNGNFILKTNSEIRNGYIHIFNELGEKLLYENNFSIAANTIQLNDICSGIYFVDVFDGKREYLKKIIVYK